MAITSQSAACNDVFVLKRIDAFQPHLSNFARGLPALFWGVQTPLQIASRPLKSV